MVFLRSPTDFDRNVAFLGLVRSRKQRSVRAETEAQRKTGYVWTQDGLQLAAALSRFSPPFESMVFGFRVRQIHTDPTNHWRIAYRFHTIKRQESWGDTYCEFESGTWSNHRFAQESRGAR